MADTSKILKKFGEYLKPDSSKLVKTKETVVVGNVVKVVDNKFKKRVDKDNVFSKSDRGNRYESDEDKRFKKEQRELNKLSKEFYKDFKSYLKLSRKKEEIVNFKKKKDSFDLGSFFLILLSIGAVFLIFRKKIEKSIESFRHGLSILGNVINIIKNFSVLGKQIPLIGKLANSVRVFLSSSPFFTKIFSFFSQMKPFFNFVKNIATGFGKVATKVLKMTKIGSGLLVFGKVFGKLLKRLPIIGNLISIGFGVGKLLKKDIIGGILDIGSGIAGFFPGIGSVISIALSLLSLAWENRVKIRKIAKKAINFLAPFVSFIKKYLGWVQPFFTIFKIGDAINKFKNKDIKGGLIDLGVGIAGLIPGLGNLIAAFIGLFQRREMVKGLVKKGLNFLTPFVDFIKKHLGWVQPFFTIFKISDAINKFKSKDIKGGLIDLGIGIVGLIPGLGNAISGLISILGGKKEEDKFKSSKKFNLRDILNVIFDNITKAITSPIRFVMDLLKESNEKTKDEGGGIFDFLKNILNILKDKVINVLKNMIDVDRIFAFFERIKFEASANIDLFLDEETKRLSAKIKEKISSEKNIKFENITGEEDLEKSLKRINELRSEVKELEKNYLEILGSKEKTEEEKKEAYIEFMMTKDLFSKKIDELIKVIKKTSDEEIKNKSNIIISNLKTIAQDL